MSHGDIFKKDDVVVYPSHGVGTIIDIECQSIGDVECKLYVIEFLRDKMVVRIPVTRIKSSGLRNLSSLEDVENAIDIFSSKPKRGNKMWSRRAQEYETKINSGDLCAIAEVVRDLYKNVDGDRSYSERTIYELALGRVADEMALVQEKSYAEVVEFISSILKEKLVAV